MYCLVNERKLSFWLTKCHDSLLHFLYLHEAHLVHVHVWVCNSLGHPISTFFFFLRSFMHSMITFYRRIKAQL